MVMIVVVIVILMIIITVKHKAIPLQGWTGPQGPKSLRLPDFKTIGILRW
jgi:hypothetical protein